MVEAIFNGQVIGSSEHAVVVEGNHYFPPGDVNQRFLRRTRMKSLCFWKGVASYFGETQDLGTFPPRLSQIWSPLWTRGFSR